MPSGELGQILIEDDDPTTRALYDLYECLFRAWRGGFTTKGRYAREAANIIAICATEDLITTKVAEEMWGNIWLITENGLLFMKGLEDDFG